MSLVRAAAQTVEQLIERVRREVGDPAADPSGNEIPAEARRFSDDDILQGLNDALLKMGNILAMRDLTEALITHTFTYAEDTDADGDSIGDDLPAGINADAIVHVVDVTTATSPSQVFYLSPLLEAELAVTETGDGLFRRFYSLSADPEGTGWKIRIRPNAAGRTFRIYHVAPPVLAETIIDAPLLSTRWRELIGLQAAFNLLSPDDEASDQLIARRNEALEEFRSAGRRNRVPKTIRLVRRPI